MNVPVILILFSLLIALTAYLIYILQKNKTSKAVEEQHEEVNDEKVIPTEMQGGDIHTVDEKIHDSNINAADKETKDEEKLPQTPISNSLPHDKLSKRTKRTFVRDTKGRFAKLKNI